MTQSLPERADARQLRTQAKDLLRGLHANDPDATSVAAAFDASVVPSTAKLADAQRLLARKYGFPSWPKLIAEVETPALLEQFRRAVNAGDHEALDRLFRRSPSLRRHINDPLFTFDAPAVIQAVRQPNAVALLRTLVRHGADPNVRSRWWAGGFGALDFAEPEIVDVLLEIGARLDVWSASAQGRVDELLAILDGNPNLVNAPGGDGMRPLHFAGNAEVAELLIQRGADLEARDVDHESTPAQYQVKRLEVLRTLVRHGATPDVFIAIVLDDADLLRRILAEDPVAVESRVDTPPFHTKNPHQGHIYRYLLGASRTPLQVAAERGSRETLKLLEPISPLGQRLVVAAWNDDADKVRSLLRSNPALGKTLNPTDARAITDAAGAGRLETVRLLLEAGVDPTTPGMDTGTALHNAAWFGHAEMVRLLVAHVPLEARDQVHGSTPLGWATHGAQWCRNSEGDYPGVVSALLAAGADIHALANSEGTSILMQAGDREDIKEILRSHGAK